MRGEARYQMIDAAIRAPFQKDKRPFAAARELIERSKERPQGGREAREIQAGDGGASLAKEGRARIDEHRAGELRGRRGGWIEEEDITEEGGTVSAAQDGISWSVGCEDLSAVDCAITRAYRRPDRASELRIAERVDR